MTKCRLQVLVKMTIALEQHKTIYMGVNIIFYIFNNMVNLYVSTEKIVSYLYQIPTKLFYFFRFRYGVFGHQ